MVDNMLKLLQYASSLIDDFKDHLRVLQDAWTKKNEKWNTFINLRQQLCMASKEFIKCADSQCHTGPSTTPGNPNSGDPGSDDSTDNVVIITSFDPNDKVGSQGAGEAHFLSGAEPLRYAVFFENLDSATAPAQEVVITDQLDTVRMDLSTLSLGPITFGNKLVTPQPGRSAFTTDVDLRPDKNLIVRITASLNPNIGLLTWSLTSIDPATGDLPADPRVGFLPPDRNPPEGDGRVVFTVMPKKGLPTGTEIRNQATIIFDVNPPINTQQWLNTLDNTKPTSQVLPLAAVQTSPTFAVQWAGTDVGSEIKDFTIRVSDNGSPFTAWLTNTATMSASYPGVLGHTYRFFSQARDHAGNIETLKTQAEATTMVVSDTTPPVITVSANPKTLWPPSGKMVPVTISGMITDNEPGRTGVNASTATYAVTDEYGSVRPSGKVTLGSNGSYSFTIQLQASRNEDDKDGRQYTITVRAQDNAGNKGSAATGVTVPHDQR